MFYSFLIILPFGMIASPCFALGETNGDLRVEDAAGLNKHIPSSSYMLRGNNMVNYKNRKPNGAIHGDLLNHERFLVERADLMDVVKEFERDDGFVTVKVKQSFYGQESSAGLKCSNGEVVATSDSVDAALMTANHFAIIYKDSNTLEKTCIWEHDVSPCYEKTLVLACDREAHQATVDVYTLLDRSKTFTKLDTVNNPSIGRCFDPLDDVIVRSKHQRVTFECTDLAYSDYEETLKFNRQYPTTCEHLKLESSVLDDGEYRLFYVDRSEGGTKHRTYTVYCHNMQHPSKMATEYITLNSSYRNYASRDVGAGPREYVRTYFKKIRLDPKTLRVNIADRTFTQTYYPKTNGPYDKNVDLPNLFGVAYSCDLSTQTARIDLRNTHFIIPNMMSSFTLAGEFPRGSLVDSEMLDQEILIKGGGKCGGHYPSSPKEAYSPVDTPLDTDIYELQLAFSPII